MSKRRPAARPWYAGRTPPSEDVLSVFDDAGESELLYDHVAAESSDGEFAGIIKGLYGKMDSLKRSPDDFRTWTEEDGYVTFYDALLDIAPAEIKGRVQVLQSLGTFKFRSSAGPDEKRKLISAVFAEQAEDEDPNIVHSSRARRLSQIWAPPSDSLLGFILARPAQAGRVLSDRLNPANDKPFQLVGHPFNDVRSARLSPIAAAKVVAFEREDAIHVIPAVRKACDQWDADAEAVGGVEQVSLLDTLLLHELVELVLREQHPDLPPMCGHIVATTFERYLKADLLTMAVEDFFLDWPPLSEEEEAERMEKELQEELREAEAMFAEEQAPEDLDDAGDDLPLDAAATPRKRIKKKKKKVVGKKKVVRKKKG